MIHYPHFALRNLYLVNGYRETKTHHGLERDYEHPDDLERCVGCVLLRKPERLRGWDLRFLRRILNISQADFGRFVDRDSQTVARWEKSAALIPAFVDQTIRSRFAQRYEPWMTVDELLTYVDGRGPKLPEKILLTFTNGAWTFLIEPWIKRANVQANASIELALPTAFTSSFRILEDDFTKNFYTQYISQSPAISAEDLNLFDVSNYSRLASQPAVMRAISSVRPRLLSNLGTEGNPDDQIRVRFR